MKGLVCLDTQEVFHRFSCQQRIYCGLVEAMGKVLDGLQLLCLIPIHDVYIIYAVRSNSNI